MNNPPQPNLIRQPLWVYASWVVLVQVLLLLPASVQAQFTYVTNNGAITITGYIGPGGKVTIPSTINGLPVTSIGQGAFAYCSSLTGITLPNSLTTIEGYAFECTSLTSITIPDSVTSIGVWAFENCSSLTIVTIGNSVANIGEQAFEFCPSLSAITVDAHNPFYSSVDGVLLNDNQTILLQYPGGKAGSYTVPNSVTSIGEQAFASCNSLTSVAIGTGVTYIGQQAFRACMALSTITVDTWNPVYSSMDGVLFNKSQTSLIQCPGGKAGNYAIPNNVTGIIAGAFQYCTGLTSVTIGSSVTNIGLQAFGWCTGLRSITVDARNPVYSSLDGVLFNKSQTFLIQYPGGKTGDYAIPNKVTSIAEEAFAYCNTLSSVTIGNSVTNIGQQAFAYCNSLTSVAISNSVTGIGDYALAFCFNLASVAMGNSVTSIGQGAFDNCTSLTNITIPNSVTNIGHHAFYSCTSLINVTIGNRVRSIGYNAFYSCTDLASVTIGSSVADIGDGAFCYCSRLSGFYFMGNTPSLGGPYIFDGDIEATVYYLPGTIGWGSTFGGRPTALWVLPYPHILDSSLGVQTNTFGFVISWAEHPSVVVEMCTNLANSIWSAAATNTLTGGWCHFSDPNWTNYRACFYRLLSP